jgi:hypothetical protein
MSTNLVPVIVAIAVGPTIATPTGAAFANITVVVTDSTGNPQAPVKLTGIETPTPYAFSTSVAPGAGVVTATAVDINGVTLGAVITQTFTEAGTPPTFAPPTALTVTPVTAAVAAAAVKR